MWPFARRGARASTPNPPITSALNYAEFSDNHACIKIWLPEVLDQAINQLSVIHDESKSAVLCGLLFEHVYGRQALEGLIAWKRAEDAKEVRQPQAPYGERPFFQLRGPRSAEIDLFGKATIAIKLWLPQRLKDDLDTLARHEQLDRSHYIRKTLVRQLLGEQRHQQWRIAIGDLPADLTQQESDDSI